MDRKEKIRKKRYRRHQGIITVFVVMIMVPTVVITGMMVDVSRLKLFQAQAAMAADSYGEVVLSQFDNVLKELYGLFAVTQSEEGKKAVEELAQYTDASFHPDSAGLAVTGSKLFGAADTEISYETIAGSSLANENVFLTQVSDFMQFRVIEQVLGEAGLFDKLEQFKNIEADSEAVSAMSDIGDSSAKTLEAIDDFYNALKAIKVYDNEILDNLYAATTAFSGSLENLVRDTEFAVEEISYSDYHAYMQNKSAIDAAREKKDKIEEKKESSKKEETLTEDEKNLADQWVDFEQYQKAIDQIIQTEDGIVQLCQESNPVNVKNFAQIAGALETAGKKIEKNIDDIIEKKEELDKKLKDCTPELKEQLEEEVKDLEAIIELKGKFKEIYELEINYNIGYNKQNAQTLEDAHKILKAVAEDIREGNKQPGTVDWQTEYTFPWMPVPTEPGSLYDALVKMYQNGSTEGGKDKNAADDKIDDARGTQSAAEDKLNIIEATSARDIPEEIMSQLKAVEPTGEVPGFTDYIKNGIQLDDFSNAGTAAFDKFLLTEYDFGMFSSRVTGIALKDEDESSAGQKEVTESSLTKVEKSKDINYLYGAELEYLFGGRQKSSSNLAAARNTICAVRMVMNTISTYSIKEVNTAIKGIAAAAAAAVAGTGIGAAAAPLVKIAVSAALRLAVASLEMVADWESLKNREEVIFWKRKLGDLKSTDIAGMLGISTDGDKSDGFALSYEDYLHVLLFVCVDTGTLVKRTSDLITLNVNQSQNSADTLSSLSFTMDQAFTAVKSTCKGRLEMVVVPENMLQLFLQGNSTQQGIEAADDKYVYYSVIRGY